MISYAFERILLSLSAAAWLVQVASVPLGPGSSNTGFNWQDEHTMQTCSPDAFDSSDWPSFSPQHDTPEHLASSAHAEPVGSHAVNPGRGQDLSRGKAAIIQIDSSAAGLPRAPWPDAAFGHQPQWPSLDGVDPAIVNAFDRWQESMRKALGNPSLHFSASDGQLPLFSSVLVAHSGVMSDDRHRTVGSLQKVVPGSEESRLIQGNHFTKNLPGVYVERNRNIDFGRAQDRTFVFLDSRHNMDYINREYFLNHL